MRIIYSIALVVTSLIDINSGSSSPHLSAGTFHAGDRPPSSAASFRGGHNVYDEKQNQERREERVGEIEPKVEIKNDTRERLAAFEFAHQLFAGINKDDDDRDKQLQAIYNCLRIALNNEEDADIVFVLTVAPDFRKRVGEFDSAFRDYMNHRGADTTGAVNEMREKMIMIAPPEFEYIYLQMHLAFVIFELAQTDKNMMASIRAVEARDPESFMVMNKLPEIREEFKRRKDSVVVVHGDAYPH
jgi:hypothetical protein